MKTLVFNRFYPGEGLDCFNPADALKQTGRLPMSNLKPAAAQMQHVGAMNAVRARKASPGAPPLHITGTFGQVQAADSLADAINRLMEQHTQEAARDRPEWMRDKDIREQYFGGCSRAHYWKVAKQPDFPAARQISPRVRVRNRFEIEKWLARQPVVA
jgi:predicted DNA-binding transcriptional regulator AlpA